MFCDRAWKCIIALTFEHGRNYDYMMYDQLLWETSGRAVISITLSELGRKNENSNITIQRQSKCETYITLSVAQR